MLVPERKIHFISGLPRSGSTLLAAILRQNPRIHATVQSALYPAVSATIRAFSSSDSELFVSDQQRRSVLKGIIECYYGDFVHRNVIIDSHRNWCSLLHTLNDLVPTARVICCVRNPAWILDSMERLVQANPYSASIIFNHEIGDVYTRVERLMTKQLVGPSLKGFAQAWASEYARMMIVVRYESVAQEPERILKALYSQLDEPYFQHDFASVEFCAPEFDARLGLAGLHTVVGPVRFRPRQTVLPADIFAKYNHEFWNAAESNPRGVTVL